MPTTPAREAMPELLSDEEIFDLAQELGGKGHALIWKDDPRYAAAFDMPKDARWSKTNVSAEQTLAFARAILARAYAASQPAEPVAWVDPGTCDIISAQRKHEWLTNYGDGGRRKASTYTQPLYAASQKPQKEAAEGWRPIESAPEGVMLLFANMKAREARDWAFVGWLAGGKICGHRMDMPTHWQPLPAAPKEPE